MYLNNISRPVKVFFSLLPSTFYLLPYQLTPAGFYNNPSNMGTLEIEVKFFLPDMDTVRDRLQQAGVESHGRFFEHNTCFENAAKDLHRNESLLRLRKDNKTTLTYKTKPAVHDADFKVFEELEVAVSDHATMLNILQALGFHRTQVYEKYRETFSIGDTELCMDSMPFGNFLEIEGEKDNIRRLAPQMGMQWPRRILYNYRAMFDVIKQQLNLPFNDITFDNFHDVDMDLDDLMPRFEAG